MKGSTPVFASSRQRRLHAKLRTLRDVNQKRELLQSELLSQLDDMWSAIVTCLEMFAGGSAWRGNMASSDAWAAAGHTLSNIPLGSMQVALPVAVKDVFEACLGSAGATGGM